ncbi:TetR family transcriptional regulator [Enterobacter sp. 10-1]|uniref:TetR/AcrR family transcriptional regulator n=1 Tax=Raoultella sp. 10-1 TaxID=2683201 RepID=UPI000BA3D540|nr:TetR family transcriptional regulator [Raoultella sp. 10-1]PAC15125.1 TetR family transcriptional regulator [Enterobacter sp. 10-1]
MLRQITLSRSNVVSTTKQVRTPGRPRQFDPVQAVEIAQHLFHSRGYDSVSIADLTKAFGINPPSFYAAFGSKLGLYTRVLDRYSHTGAIPFAELLRADRSVAQCLIDVLNEAARRYVADPTAAGCLVLEGIHCNDRPAREAASELHTAAEDNIRAYIAQRYPQDAVRLADFISTLMAGLSAKARAGDSLERLQETVRLAGLALEQLLPR